MFHFTSSTQRYLLPLCTLSWVLLLTACTSETTVFGSASKDLKPVELDPGKEYLNLGINYMQQGKFDLAESRLRRSIAAKQTPEAYNALALLYENMHDNISAEKTYTELTDNFPDYPLGFSNYLIFLCRYERWPQITALSISNKKTAEVSAVTEITTGDCYLRNKRLEEAKSHYERAISYVPLSAGALLPLAEIEYQNGYVNEAKTRVDMVLNQIGFSPRALYLAGLIAGDSGDKIKQREYFRTLRIRYPNSPEARNATN